MIRASSGRAEGATLAGGCVVIHRVPLLRALVEEASHSLLVLTGTGLLGTDVPRLGQAPNFLGLAGGLVEGAVESRLVGVVLGRVDEQHGARGDLVDEVDQVGGGNEFEKTAVPAVIPALKCHRPEFAARDAAQLADRADGGALGDDGLHVLAVGRGLKESLAANGQSEASDAIGLDVGPALQEVDRGEQVALAVVPGVGVGIAVALALSTTVEDEHAVAMAGEHPGGALGALAPERHHHGGAVLRWHVGALERQPVVRVQLDLLDGRAAEVDVVHRRPGRMRAHVRIADRKDEECRDQERRELRWRPAAPSGAPGRRARRRVVHSVTSPRPSSATPAGMAAGR